MTPDYTNLQKYPKQYLCKDQLWEKFLAIINKTSHHYSEEGDAGIITPSGTRVMYASSFSD